MAAQQLVDVGVSAETIFLEPCGRNTAAAVATAALLSLKEDPILWILPSDHSVSRGIKRARKYDKKRHPTG